jgi:phenylpropionate dioxygenase-like ring-hydroxylating dioxygenase large terminal subunit
VRLELQQALIDRVLAHLAARTTDCAAGERRVSAAEYWSAAHFERERAHIFSALPLPVAPSAALREAGDFVSFELCGRPLVLSRDKTGTLHAHINSCRHRGTRLVTEPRGSAQAFVCPYHGWSYGCDGALTGLPHREHFPGCDREALGLHKLPVFEAAGLVWLHQKPTLADDILALDIGDHVVFDTSERTWNGNWKTFIDGALEAYHFRVLHARSIYPLFFDNVMLFDSLDDHQRIVLPKRTIVGLADDSRSEWRLRAHANLVYLLFPCAAILVQSDHIVVIGLRPLDPDHTHITVTMLIPRHADKPVEYWQKNFRITLAALDEDFSMGERIFVRAGDSQEFVFGRNELALAAFHDSLERRCGRAMTQP